MRSIVYTLPLSLALVACADEADKTAAPRYDALAAAKADGPVIAGALGFSEASIGALSRAVPRQTWILEARPGAIVDLEVTHKGTTAALDTVMIVVGPVTSDVATSPVVAEDDDSGWGLHSRIRGLTLAGGRYLVTVQSYDGRQKGSYRLVAACRSGACEPVATTGVARDDRYCHPTLKAGIERCVDEQLADVDRDPATWTSLDVGLSCVDAEPVARWRDAVCADESPAPSWCALDYEAFMNTQVTLCQDGAVAYAMGRECALGAGFWDLRDGTATATVTHRRVIAEGAALTSLEAEQLVAAVRVAYEDDVTDVASALDAVDGGEVNQLRVWDATAHRGFVAYEYGAGDNSYGGILEDGGTRVVVEIRDGDYPSCVLPGDELATCAADGDCASGMRCTGITAGRGRCVAPHDFPAEGTSCNVSTSPCPAASGLVCAGVDARGDGLCLPAWMRGRFEDWAVEHIPARATITRTLGAWGLTTVSTDVTVRLIADFPTPADLRVTLTNPATTVGIVWDGERGASPLELERAIRAFPGDESANGDWTLTIENRGASTGTLVSWGLDIMSRWD